MRDVNIVRPPASLSDSQYKHLATVYQRAKIRVAKANTYHTSDCCTIVKIIVLVIRLFPTEYKQQGL